MHALPSRLSKSSFAFAGAAALAAAFLFPVRTSAAEALLSPSEIVGHSSSSIEIVFLGNEGVMLSAGDRRVAIDALFGAGLREYQVVPQNERAALESARGDYGEIQLLLATHAHADHFDAAAIARHLAANPEALFVSTPETVEATLEAAAKASGGDWSDRARAVLPAEPGGREVLAWHGVRVHALNLHHGQLERPVQHLVYVVELAGRRIVDLGDSEASEAELAAALGREHGRVDLLLVPYWRLLDADGREALRRVFEPRRIAAFHFPAPGASAQLYGKSGSLAALRVELAREWPGIVLATEPGLRLTIGGG